MKKRASRKQIKRLAQNIFRAAIPGNDWRKRRFTRREKLLDYAFVYPIVHYIDKSLRDIFKSLNTERVKNTVIYRPPKVRRTRLRNSMFLSFGESRKY